MEQNNSNTTGKNYLPLIIAITVAFYVGVAWGGRNQEAGIVSFTKNLSDPKQFIASFEKSKPKDVDFNIFWEAWEKFDQKHINEEKLNDPQERVYGAIRGMIASLDDPYSGFMDPKEAEDFDQDMEGSFEGIGAELGMKEEILTVIAPIEGMPAQKAGLRAGDKIIKINGELAADHSIEEAVRKIRGPKGTEVTLTVLRNGEGKTKEITITRDHIELESVIYEKKENGVGYIRITKFVEDTTDEFNKAMVKLITDNCRGVVIDVRNNPGGYLETAIEITSRFVPEDQVIVWEQGRDGKKESYKALGGSTLADLPVVVIQNEGSASASEILAGALRDIKNAPIIGAKSFGKGSVQVLETLDDGSSLRITIAKWLTPSGASIHDVGLSPDIEVEFTEEDYENDRDPQLDRAIEELEERL